MPFLGDSKKERNKDVKERIISQDRCFALKFFCGLLRILRFYSQNNIEEKVAVFHDREAGLETSVKVKEVPFL